MPGSESFCVLSASRPRLRGVPTRVPAKRTVIYASGVVEVACAVGLLRREPWAGPVSAATLLAIWPANIQMALDAGIGRNPLPADSKLLTWARVPMQLALIWAALQAKPGKAG